MLKIIESASIEASTDVTWKVLSDIENNITTAEHWATWNDGTSFGGESFSTPLIKSVNNTWSLLSQNGKTVLKTESRIILRGGVFGKLLEPFMRSMVNRMAAEALAGFKFLVENGHSFERKNIFLSQASAAS